nr:MAG TPA: hypothetical protein [Caudoviricetes sp.]
MRQKTMGGPSPEFAKAKEVHTGRVQDSTSRVRSIINSTMNTVSSAHKAAKSGCSRC